MKKILYNKIILAILVSLISILLYSCKEKGKVIFTGSSEESHDYRFSAFIENIGKFPYEAEAEKRKRVTGGFSKLTLGLNKDDVKKMLGEPDAEFFDYDTTRGKTYVGSSWGYYLRRHEAKYANDKYDQVVFIYFNPEEKLYLAIPDNIDSLHTKGSPYNRKR